MSAEPEDMTEGRDPKEAGLLPKYTVYRNIPGTQSPDGSYSMEPVTESVFVLKPESDPLALQALEAYSVLARADGRVALAEDIENRVDRIRAKQKLRVALGEAAQEKLKGAYDPDDDSLFGEDPGDIER